MPSAEAQNPPAILSTSRDARTGAERVTVGGRLDARSTPRLWREAETSFPPSGRADSGQRTSGELTIDASEVTYCDGAGAAFLLSLEQRAREAGRNASIVGLSEDFERLLRQFDLDAIGASERSERRREPFFIDLGMKSVGIWNDLYGLLSFLGETCSSLVHAVRHPRAVRWRDVLLTAELAGADALPIIALIGFLLGLILSFQSAIPMSQFGVEVYVSDLVAVSVIRELGPLMTAIILAGRSGSAFAAEIGTMKVNEEVDALNTMGLNPIYFLVLPRLIAVVIILPFLAIFSEVFSLIGSAVVMRSFGYPFTVFADHVTDIVTLGDLMGGLFKALVFGMLVAGIGCLRGLETRTGASGVGRSTTSAVVSGIVLIAIADGAFAVMFYYLGI